MQKNADAFRTISEVADDLSLPQHVLRFWETRFPQVRPLKRAGGRRYYRPNDIQLLRTIRQLLYDDGYTIKGVQRLLKEQGARGLGTQGFGTQGFGTQTPGVAQADVDQPLLDAAAALPAHEADLAAVGEPNPSDVTTLTDEDRRDLEAALATVEECQRILGALQVS